MARKIELPWGKDSLEVSLPDSWRVLGILKPDEAEAPSDPSEACRQALAAPFGAQRLAERDLAGKKIVVVVDDHSRPTPVSEFITPVLEEIASAGAADEDVEILVATGVHRDSTPEEVKQKIGDQAFGRFRWSCNRAYDPAALTDVGTTARGTRVFINSKAASADLVVCLGAIEPHLLLGFGGGLKIIVPGCAGVETIAHNHLQGASPDHFDYVGASADNSPMRLDLEEGVLLSGREFFIVNAAMNENARPTRFFCGDPREAHREGAKFVSRVAELNVPEPADVVLANSYPMDSDLRQSIKCMGNSMYAVRPGGALLACAKCDHGLGEMPLPPKTLPYGFMKGLVGVLGGKRILPLVKKLKKNEPVEEVFVSHFGLQMLRRNHLAIFSDSPLLPENVGRKLGLARSFTSTDDLIRWTAARVPRNASVWVFPYGGSTYASPNE